MSSVRSVGAGSGYRSLPWLFVGEPAALQLPHGLGGWNRTSPMSCIRNRRHTLRLRLDDPSYCAAWCPGVELNHASDVRSVGSDPSAGAESCSSESHRLTALQVRGPHWSASSSAQRRSSTGRESNPRSALCRRVPCHLATGAQFRCEDSNLDSWCQRPAPCHWTTPEHLRRAVTRGRTEPSRIPGERAAPRSP